MIIDSGTSNIVIVYTTAIWSITSQIDFGDMKILTQKSPQHIITILLTIRRFNLHQQVSQQKISGSLKFRLPNMQFYLDIYYLQ